MIGLAGQSAASGQPMLLERETQLTSLRRLLAAARRQRGRLVLLAGEAGIGKTTLAEAFCAQAAPSARVFWGSCEPVIPARPFAPIAQIARSAGGQLRLAVETANPDAIFSGFMALLRVTRARPTIVVLDDVHWADEATLELLRLATRQLADLPALLLATYRDHDVSPDHPLSLALADVPAEMMVELRVGPLSQRSIERLAAGTSADPVVLHQTTGGNPFFVIESLATDDMRVPPTVRDAVLSRAARLSAQARELLDAGSVLGQRFHVGLAQHVASVGEVALAECQAGGLLLQDGEEAWFRHELARLAIREVVAPEAAAELHRRTYEALAARADTDPARLAVHAEGWGDPGAILKSAPLAAERASMLGAHREAAAHYAAAASFAAGLDERARAELLTAHAREALRTDDPAAALVSQREALYGWRQLGDRLREGDCLRQLSTTMYFTGEGERARAVAEMAVEMLESLPASRELALAYATVAQRIITSGYDEELGLHRASQALALAELLGDEEAYVHALTTIGVSQVYSGAGPGWARLEEAAGRATASGLAEAASRAFINLVECALDLRLLQRADHYVQAAMAALGDRDFDVMRRVLEIRLAELAFARGRWAEAEEAVDRLAGRPRTANRVLVRALTLCGRLLARSGRGDPWPALDRALALVGEGELQEITPLRTAIAEAALLEGGHAVRRAADEAASGLALARIPPSGEEGAWWWGELAFLAWRSGAADSLPDGAPQPYALHALGRWREAAEAWRHIGCPYESALALADSEEEADLREALDIFLRLGARPMAEVVSGRLRRLGARQISRGPRPSTRADPIGLTRRERQVLEMLGLGLTNAEIARRLVLSVRTVDRHVESVLRKTDARNRRAAVAVAARRRRPRQIG